MELRYTTQTDSDTDKHEIEEQATQLEYNTEKAVIRQIDQMSVIKTYMLLNENYVVMNEYEYLAVRYTLRHKSTLQLKSLKARRKAGCEG